MDSRALFHQITVSTKLQLAKIYKFLPIMPPRSSLRVDIVPTQQQDGVHDCGLFAVAYATEVCFNRRPEDTTFKQRSMRQHLIRCLNAEYFEPFPKSSTSTEILPRPTHLVKYIKLYCVCHMPAEFDERMICCDRCNKWFHLQCVSCDSTKIPASWKCPTCNH